MKRSFPLIIIITVSLWGSSSFTAATARENERLQHGKITKNQAQHLVMKKYPGATIKSCILTNEKEHGIWVVEFNKAGSQEISKVQIDGLTGKIVP